MDKEKIKSAIKKTIRYMNGSYYSKFEEKMIVGYLVGALKELEDWYDKKRSKTAIHIYRRHSIWYKRIEFLKEVENTSNYNITNKEIIRVKIFGLLFLNTR